MLSSIGKRAGLASGSLSSLAQVAPGLALCLAVAVFAALLGGVFPLIGGPVFAIILGMLLGNAIRMPTAIKPGIAFVSKKLLQTAIVALGGSLSLSQVLQTGTQSLVVMLCTLAAAFIVAWLSGRMMGVSPHLATLVGVGTGICGGSAIAAVAPIIKAEDDEIAFSLSTVFLFNVVAVLVFPLLGRALGLGDTSFGLWAGTAINDTSSVVAAGYAYSPLAGEYATIVKLTRTTMIIPITLALAIWEGRKSGQATYSFSRVFPWFIAFFAIASLLNTVGVFGEALPPLLGAFGKHLITLALAGVGLGASVRNMIKIGPKPVVLGLMVWVLVAVTSLLVQRVTGL